MRINTISLLILFISHISFGKSDPKLITFNTKDIDSNTKEITITFIVPEKDYIYKDFIRCSIDQPEITLSEWKTDKQSINYYDPCFNDTKQIFNETFSISMTVTKKEHYSNPLHLYCSYYRKTDNTLNDALFTFSFEQSVDTSIQVHDAEVVAAEANQSNNFHAHTHYSPLDQYYLDYSAAIYSIVTFLRTNHQTCFLVIIILAMLFFLFFYLCQEQLQRHKKLSELIEMIISLLMVISIIYLLFYGYNINNPSMHLISSNISVIFSVCAGIFYIKKSTELQSGFLRTFCNCAGIFFMSSTVFLLFKTIQYVDEYIGLLP